MVSNRVSADYQFHSVVDSSLIIIMYFRNKFGSKSAITNPFSLECEINY